MPSTEPPAARAPQPQPREGERGAVVVVGVFVALFLVGLLYYSVGVGRSVLARELLQDTADTTAYSAAVVYARGMNILAILNVIIAAAYAIILVTQVILALAHEAQDPMVYPGVSAAERGRLAQVETEARDISMRVLAPMQQAARAAHASGMGLRADLATVAARAAPELAPRPPLVRASFAHPRVRPLPIDPVSTGTICDEIAATANYVGFAPFQRIAPLTYESQLSSQLALRTSAATVCPLADPAMLPFELANVPLGDEVFQVRAFVAGAYHASNEDRGVRAANRWNDEPGALGPTLAPLRAMTSLALAQAEFVYDGALPRELWLWDPSWRARLRRVSVPAGMSTVELSATCAQDPRNSDCDRFTALDLGLLGQVTIH